MFGLAEAKALITEHRAAVLAIAEALMIHRRLDSAQIDSIVASAPEQAAGPIGMVFLKTLRPSAQDGKLMPA